MTISSVSRSCSFEIRFSIPSFKEAELLGGDSLIAYLAFEEVDLEQEMAALDLGRKFLNIIRYYPRYGWKQID